MDERLDDHERQMLDYLLSAELEGAAELRAQAATARVVGRCPCGCPTIELWVDRAATPRAAALRDTLHAKTYIPAPSAGPAHVYLFVEDGWLSELEFVGLSEPTPSAFPALSEFGPVVDGSTSLGPTGPPTAPTRTA